MTSNPIDPDDSRPGNQPPPYSGAGYGPYPGMPQNYGNAPVPSASEDRTWGMISHLGALGALFFTGFLGFVVPLVVMTTKGQQSPFVRRHAIASLNFQLTLLVVGVVGSIAAVIGAIVTLGIGLLLIIPAVLAYVVFALVVMIKATMRASSGEDYDYPLTFRFVS